MALQLMHKHCPTLHIDVNLRDTINFDVTLCPRLELYGSVVVILGVFVWGLLPAWPCSFSVRNRPVLHKA